MSFNRKRRLKNPCPFDRVNRSQVLVRVLSGRTRYRPMVVVRVFEEKGKLMALVADGDKYSVSMPKRKAAAQLEYIRDCSAKTDEEIRSVVKSV